MDTLPNSSASEEEDSVSQVRRWKRFLPFVAWGMLLCSILGMLSIVGVFWFVGRELPDLSSLKNYHPWQITKVLDVDGKAITEFARQRRTSLAFYKIPKHLVQAVIAAEDADFYKHKGLDYLGILRAFWKNLWRKKGAPKQGGSTITQQVVKTFLLSFEQTYTRKIREAILARNLEQNLKKNEILFLYLNQIYFGRGRFGVEEAAKYYFGKSAEKLSVMESAILAGIPKNPERYNPANSIALTTRRRNYVLHRMWKNHFITEKQYKTYRKQKVQRPPTYKSPEFVFDYYTEEVRLRAIRILSKLQKGRIKAPVARRQYALNQLYRGGLQIETAMDSNAQKLAIRSLRKGLRALERRRGYRGPLRRSSSPEEIQFLLKALRVVQSKGDTFGLMRAVALGHSALGVLITIGEEEGLIPWSDLSWALFEPVLRKGKLIRKKRSALKEIVQKGDLIWVARLPMKEPASNKQKLGKPFPIPLFSLEQTPQAQGAVVVLHPSTHRVRALVGGWDFRISPFNRATQALRQPGSVFKPFVYAAALVTRKYSAASLFNDTYFQSTKNGKRWSPKNANNRYSNRPVSLRNAFAHSINTVAVRLIDAIGTQKAIDLARRLGIRSPLTTELSLALGASAVRPLEITNAYATIAAQGVYDDPVFISRILDAKGKVLYDRLPDPKRVLEGAVSYIMTSLMEDVVRVGTAKAALGLKRPIAGKTGTTNKARDAWFIGYTPDLCMGVWVGFDDRKPLGSRESGGKTALPIFIDFMQKYHVDKQQKTFPARHFYVPPETSFVKIDSQSGLLAPPESSNFFFEVFLEGTAPREYKHSKQKASLGKFYELPL